jgi:hypothetical protein
MKRETKPETKQTILQAHLEALGACREAREWAGDRSPLAAWDECERADWLLWWAARTKVDTKQKIVLAACACARQALRFVPADEKRPLRAIEAAERWAKNPTEKKRKAAARAADAAAYAAAARAADAAAYAAAAAAAAARAADAAAYAAAAAATDTARAARAAAYAAYAVAEHKTMCVAIRNILVCPYEAA